MGSMGSRCLAQMEIVFASNRNQVKRGDINLFIAEWNYK
tara:strand:+ start:138 stop:254 length:117 start_codon:yes stop_codon:yes gene_type:complete